MKTTVIAMLSFALCAAAQSVLEDRKQLAPQLTISTTDSMQTNWLMIECFWESAKCQRQSPNLVFDASDEVWLNEAACYWQGMSLAEQQPWTWSGQAQSCVTLDTKAEADCAERNGTWVHADSNAITSQTRGGLTEPISFCIRNSSLLISNRRRLHEFETNKNWEQGFNIAKWRAMWHWPSWEEFSNEAYCNIEGTFTTLEPYIWHQGEQRCITYDELEEIAAAQTEEFLEGMRRMEEAARQQEEAIRLEEEERQREEEHVRETASLKQECEDGGDTWMTPADIGQLVTEAHEVGVHGYCVSLTPQLMQIIHNNVLEENDNDYNMWLQQANCYYGGVDQTGLPLTWDDNLQKCITFEEEADQLAQDCLAEGHSWLSFQNTGFCVDEEIDGGIALSRLRRRNGQTFAYKFNGMQVDLFRKQEFDSWFDTKMYEAPQQLHLWKKHFDRWANKRMAKVLAEEVTESEGSNTITTEFEVDEEALEQVLGIFDDFWSSFEDQGGDLFNDLSDQLDQVISEQSQIAGDLEELLNTATEMITDSITITTTDTTSTATQELLSKHERQQSYKKADEDSSSAFVYGTGAIIIALAVAGGAFYHNASKSQKKIQYDNEEPLL